MDTKSEQRERERLKGKKRVERDEGRSYMKFIRKLSLSHEHLPMKIKFEFLSKLNEYY